MNEMHGPIDELLTGELSISPTGRQNLEIAAGWGNFLAILAFILVGLMVIIALLMGSMLTSLGAMAGEELPFPPAIFSVFYLIIAAVYFFPALYLFRFASRMKLALRNNSQIDLESSFANLKSLYKFLGIIAIISLVLYAVVILGAVLYAGSLATLGS